MKLTFITQLFLIHFLLGFTCTVLLGQHQNIDTQKQVNKNKLTFYGGFHYTKSQDLVYSPLIYKGGGGNAFGLRYERFSRRGFHQLNIAYDHISVASTAPPVSFDLFGKTITRIDSRAKQFYINYGYVEQLNRTSKFAFYLGGLLEAKINLLDYQFGLNDEIGYSLIHSISPWVVSKFSISLKQYLQVEVHFPLLAYSARPDYSIVDNEEIQHEGSDFTFLYNKGTFASINTFQAIHFSLAYHREISSLIHLNFNYDLGYLKYKKPATTTILKNNFDIGIAFNF